MMMFMMDEFVCMFCNLMISQERVTNLCPEYCRGLTVQVSASVSVISQPPARIRQ